MKHVKKILGYHPGKSGYTHVRNLALEAEVLAIKAKQEDRLEAERIFAQEPHDPRNELLLTREMRA